MKKIVFISLAMMFFSAVVKAGNVDTLDFWRVYYNGVKIREFNETVNEVKELLPYKIINLKLDSIKNEDIISVGYRSDAPYPGCEIYLTFYDGINEVVIGKSKGNLQDNSVSFPVKTLITFTKMRGEKTFEIFYSEKAENKTYRKQSVFIIQLK